MNPIRYFGIKAFSAQLEETGPSLSFKRLCTSRHVDDLQSIASGAIICMILAFAFLFVAVVAPKGMHEGRSRTAVTTIAAAVQNTPVGDDETGTFFQRLTDDIVPFAGAIALLSATLSWTYQAGSNRLGAVDLFASEIAAINRVCLVVDFARSSVAQARARLPACTSLAENNMPAKFTSAEHYTPVYDNNTSSLQSLDFDVVTEVTQFYTYRKTMMDFMRKIAEAKETKGLIEARKHMIYMQFLMYESGRKALEKLIEFEPEQSSVLVGAYCNELALFALLKEEYTEDFLGRRLDMRHDDYDDAVTRLKTKIDKKYKQAEDAKKKPNNWKKAWVTAPEMVKRHDEMIAELDRIRSTKIPNQAAA